MKEAETGLLGRLVSQQPVASLSTLHEGAPAISMVPFAVLPDGSAFVIHVSSLASHTRDMESNPQVAVLVTGSPGDADTTLALPRLSIQGRATLCSPDEKRYAEARSCYLDKLPDAEPLFSFTDFSLWLIKPETLRFVAGFGRAMSLSPERFSVVVKGIG